MAKVRVIFGIKLGNGKSYISGEVVDFSQELANELIVSGEAEACGNVRENKKSATLPIKKGELAKLQYRTLQIKAKELGMARVAGKPSLELAEFILSNLTPEEVLCFIKDEMARSD